MRAADAGIGKSPEQKRLYPRPVPRSTTNEIGVALFQFRGTASLGRAIRRGGDAMFLRRGGGAARKQHRAGSAQGNGNRSLQRSALAQQARLDPRGDRNQR